MEGGKPTREVKNQNGRITFNLFDDAVPKTAKFPDPIELHGCIDKTGVLLNTGLKSPSRPKRGPKRVDALWSSADYRADMRKALFSPRTELPCVAGPSHRR